MKNNIWLFFNFLLLFACQEQTQKTQKIDTTQEIATELARMVVVDQTAAGIPQGRFKGFSPEFKAYKDSVFTTHKVYLEQIFDQHGFPGFDLIGKEASHDYWLMVQHCDFDPVFQEKVLQSMKKQVDKGNAISSNYAYLIDRVRKNTGRKLLYGTQVQYNMETGQAFSFPLEDSLQVNARRAKVGLGTLEEYLNDMTLSHFEMNKERYLVKGITKPALYEVSP